MAQIPAKHAGWAEAALQEANRKSLREALLELGSRLPNVSRLLGWSPEFIGQVVGARNDFSHAKQAPELRHHDLVRARERLRLMLEAQLLSMAGLTDRAMVRALTGSRRLQLCSLGLDPGQQTPDT
jgi:hypothetical protein